MEEHETIRSGQYILLHSASPQCISNFTSGFSLTNYSFECYLVVLEMKFAPDKKY